MSCEQDDSSATPSQVELALESFIEENAPWCEKYEAILGKLGSICMRYAGIPLQFDPRENPNNTVTLFEDGLNTWRLDVRTADGLVHEIQCQPGRLRVLRGKLQPVQPYHGAPNNEDEIQLSREIKEWLNPVMTYLLAFPVEI